MATELPEKFNSVIWIRARKDTLALGNITGAMVFQSTFPVSVGLLFTDWRLPFVALFSGVLALFSGIVFYVHPARAAHADVVVAGRRRVDVRRLPGVRAGLHR